MKRRCYRDFLLY